MTKETQIQNEIMSRRTELINLEKRNGGTVAIRLKTENLDYCYRKGRQPEPFYLQGTLRGMPVILNESEVL